MDLVSELSLYEPYNEQEQKDKKIILSCLKNQNDIFYRTNELCHITSSAWVVNEHRNKVLMAYHNIYDSWAWLGGHNDGNENCLEVAIKEVKEESGLKSVEPLRNEIFSIEVLTVDGHLKNNQYVSSHLHLNITYLLQASESQKLQCNPCENKDVRWFSLEDVLTCSNEQWMIERVYTKLNNKLRIINQ
ncbi:NUDIX hydrolase [Floccifex sp.]|uniref:NUDIX hydrolase n=1 Tax=Floccifex sp. TaxID=2815810 RepID=UPI002A7658F9|nr:NUDIX hydrolase [Floccifex sp.]MDD7280635.1 NUDIX hydrolase [Erysipelotrichaceae bacterium]MDY2958411.1 NUDIX hydrolase [Floccifex sp.]